MDLSWFKYLFPGQIDKVDDELKVLKERKAAADEKRLSSKFTPTASEQKILDALHPIVSAKILKTLQDATKGGICVILFSGLRTFQKQDALYNQGRDAAGNIVDPKQIVTMARAGASWHNYAVAADIVMNLGPRPQIHPTWDDFVDVNKDGSNDWMTLGNIGVNNDLEWGGAFKNLVDVPHFQYRKGIASIDDALRLYNTGGLPEVWKHIT
jgi:peptidoglycan L-alanyl-D-glutamate endopeptidase CwlK